MMNDAFKMMIMKWLMSSNERDVKLLRSLTTLDGRDVIELELRKCYESYDE